MQEQFLKNILNTAMYLREFFTTTAHYIFYEV